MADHLSLCSDNMKDSRSTNESPTDLCDESNQEIKDELEPGFVEERFRVDRKKLEQMLQGKLLKLHTSGKSTRHSEEYIFIFLVVDTCECVVFSS